MNVTTGEIASMQSVLSDREMMEEARRNLEDSVNKNLKELSNLEQKIAQHKGDWKPIKRPLTKREHHKKRIEMYDPCGCGSEKKFKFCCHKK